MNQRNLSVLFLLKKEKTNKQGTCPIYCRITYLKRRKQFSTGEFIAPFEWNAKKQLASSRTVANQQINLQLEIITVNIKKAYL
ncbi:Arm DNA-binding domain-containing protein [uncultured Maribacter sp.]|uniref:Arm DNA-binding domain-containing protein n=1 Tax=uncultured Maribacter sp. TaxID=431308 RepID=UPI0030D93627|tara:strand:+ start:159 stop:407 length:249 start_codon:yes stop_codon:yes gene_type:complete